ncbi:unnamed protein product [Allacma fusca]|uniref:Uncharacterized protein n=1 Tax=Allacma fusca TaxID=39272 RepID=A0A8J2NLG9_9HEXA|nr:unnamed protein product [Allacma fusca]
MISIKSYLDTSGCCNERLLSMKDLRLITFDVTGTLLKFRKPPAQQYMEIGLKHGVTANEERMKHAFKKQWIEMNESQPNYGTCWRSWWTQFVIKTFQDSQAGGNATEENLRAIASELIEHFTTSECWEAKEGATELLLAVKHLESPKSRGRTAENDSEKGKELEQVSGCRSSQSSNGGSRKVELASPTMQIGVVSNFDPRLEQILRATQLHHFFDWLLTSHECQVSKPHQGIFNAALLAATRNHSSRLLPIQPAQALHIGDSYGLDLVGAVNAGWNAILVMSPQEQKNIPPHILNSDPPVVFNDLIQLKSYLQSII